MRQQPPPIPMEHRVPVGRQVSGVWIGEAALQITVMDAWTDARNPQRRDSVECSSYLYVTQEEFAALALSLGYVPNVKET